MIDIAGHAARAAAGGVQAEPRRAGGQDAAHAIWTALEGKPVAGASCRGHRAGRGQLLQDDVDDALDSRVTGILSNARILASRRI